MHDNASGQWPFVSLCIPFPHGPWPLRMPWRQMSIVVFLLGSPTDNDGPCSTVHSLHNPTFLTSSSHCCIALVAALRVNRVHGPAPTAAYPFRDSSTGLLAASFAPRIRLQDRFAGKRSCRSLATNRSIARGLSQKRSADIRGPFPAPWNQSQPLRLVSRPCHV